MLWRTWPCVWRCNLGFWRPVSYTHLDVYKRQDPNNPPATVSASAISSTSSAINNTISAKSADTTPLNYGFSQTSSGSASATNDVTTLASVSLFLIHIWIYNASSTGMGYSGVTGYAIGNQLNVNTSGSFNTVVVNSSQVNNGNQTVIINGSSACGTSSCPTAASATSPVATTQQTNQTQVLNGGLNF